MKSVTGKYCIIANKAYGLYCGVVTNVTPSAVDETMTVEIAGCRHIAKWYGRGGGITSLARYGICGDSADQSRIGAAVDAVCGGVVNIFVCHEESRASLEAYGA